MGLPLTVCHEGEQLSCAGMHGLEWRALLSPPPAEQGSSSYGKSYVRLAFLQLQTLAARLQLQTLAARLHW